MADKIINDERDDYDEEVELVIKMLQNSNNQTGGFLGSLFGKKDDIFSEIQKLFSALTGGDPTFKYHQELKDLGTFIPANLFNLIPIKLSGGKPELDETHGLTIIMCNYLRKLIPRREKQTNKEIVNDMNDLSNSITNFSEIIGSIVSELSNFDKLFINAQKGGFINQTGGIDVVVGILIAVGVICLAIIIFGGMAMITTIIIVYAPQIGAFFSSLMVTINNLIATIPICVLKGSPENAELAKQYINKFDPNLATGELSKIANQSIEATRQTSLQGLEVTKTIASEGLKAIGTTGQAAIGAIGAVGQVAEKAGDAISGATDIISDVIETGTDLIGNDENQEDNQDNNSEENEEEDQEGGSNGDILKDIFGNLTDINSGFRLLMEKINNFLSSITGFFKKIIDTFTMVFYSILDGTKEFINMLFGISTTKGGQSVMIGGAGKLPSFKDSVKMAAKKFPMLSGKDRDSFVIPVPPTESMFDQNLINNLKKDKIFSNILNKKLKGGSLFNFNINKIFDNTFNNILTKVSKSNNIYRISNKVFNYEDNYEDEKLINEVNNYILQYKRIFNMSGGSNIVKLDANLFYNVESDTQELTKLENNIKSLSNINNQNGGNSNVIQIDIDTIESETMTDYDAMFSKLNTQFNQTNLNLKGGNYNANNSNIIKLDSELLNSELSEIPELPQFE